VRIVRRTSHSCARSRSAASSCARSARPAWQRSARADSARISVVCARSVSDAGPGRRRRLRRDSKLPRRVMTLRSVTAAPTGSADAATSPGENTGGVSGQTAIASRPSIDSDSRPASTAIRRSTPGKAENGPLEHTSAMLTRQSKVVRSLCTGYRATSRVTPPPFFQGTAARSAARSVRTTARAIPPP
jgi:hypothetical protein